jgi:hypothetical protein
MKFETKWKLFKAFTRMISLVAGGLLVWSIRESDLALLVASIALFIGGASFSIFIGFFEGIIKELGGT